jgi:general secretion pathway protein A
MYESFFGLQQEPFSIAPDPRFLYMSDKHREALALLNTGLARGASFVLLTGEIGAGKTTVWRRFLEELPSNFDVASVVNPKLDVHALLARVCEDLHMEASPAGRAVDLIDALHGHLLLAHAQGRRTLIVIDEAQALSNDVLEQLRLLTNLDSSGKKLQVMLIGQPELRQILQRPQLEPLAQRLVARYHLPALSAAETVGYIEHRLNVAGLNGPMPFDGESLAAIHRLCQGIPRRINVLCDRALVAAFSQGSRRVDAATVERAAAETFGERIAPAAPAPNPTERPAPVRSGVSSGAMLLVAGVALVAGVLLAPRLTGVMSSAPAGLPGGLPAAAPVAPVATAANPQPPGPAPLPAISMPLPSIDAIFSGTAVDESAAWRSLAPLWGASLPPGDPCTVAVLQQLQCFRSRGGLAPIRQLERPGFLKLVDDRGRVAHVLLTALDEDSATLTIAGVPRSVPLVHLARLWRGEFFTFWRAPPGFREGEPASVVLSPWLLQRLSGLDGQSAAAAGDEALRARVFAFQLAHGLTPDGVAGPLTLMALNRASGIDEPKLVTSGSRPS